MTIFHKEKPDPTEELQKTIAELEQIVARLRGEVYSLAFELPDDNATKFAAIEHLARPEYGVGINLDDDSNALLDGFTDAEIRSNDKS